jgi:hypothetical protein
MHSKMSMHTDGRLIRVSSVRRPGSKDTHRHEQNFFYLDINQEKIWLNFRVMMLHLGYLSPGCSQHLGFSFCKNFLGKFFRDLGNLSIVKMKLLYTF